MIHLQSVTKKFGNHTAVSEMTLEIAQGEIVGFLGVNGAGKTTTMRLITGVHHATSGTVRVFNKSPVQQPQAVLSHIGYLPENNPLYPELLVKEYLSFMAHIKGKKEYIHIANEVGLGEKLTHKIASLSRGYRQRVGLAASLLGNPQILILDEPTSGLDPIEQERIRDVIRAHAQEKIVLFSTHILAEAFAIATRIVMIHNSKKVYDGEKPHTLHALETLFKTKVADAISI